MFWTLIAVALAHPAGGSDPAPWLAAVAVPPVVIEVPLVVEPAPLIVEPIAPKPEPVPVEWVSIDDTPSDELPDCPTVPPIVLVDGQPPAFIEGLPTFACDGPDLPADYWTGTPVDEP